MGVILYWMEFLFIIPFYKEPPGEGASNSEIAAFYTANRTDILGVLLFAAALRSVLARPGTGGLRAFSPTSPSLVPSSPSRYTLSPS